MSATIVLAPTLPPAQISAMSSTCTHCGNNMIAPDDAHLRIQDLEAQVRLLNSKAAAAVDKLADYEDEVRSLRSAYAQLQQKQQQSQPQPMSSSSSTTPTAKALQPPLPPLPSQPHSHSDQPLTSPTLTPATTPPATSSPPRNASRLASLSSFLPGRKRDTALLTPSTALFGHLSPSTPTPTIDPSLDTLQATLETERTLRLRAESDLTQTQSELEELTATLFGQANEMVAQERKARAKLEERVRVLEDRDGEKRRRLERLEGAVKRIERVRGLMKSEEEEKEKGDVRIAVVEVDADEHRGETRGDGELRVVNQTPVKA